MLGTHWNLCLAGTSRDRQRLCELFMLMHVWCCHGDVNFRGVTQTICISPGPSAWCEQPMAQRSEIHFCLNPRVRHTGAWSQFGFKASVFWWW